ncbi:MAG: DNA-binding response regulator, partial [Prevotella sp.]|nr:DNA-binding response regulator [Prevotella sp.]
MDDNKARILVVDDEEDLCEILKFNLETEGY